MIDRCLFHSGLRDTPPRLAISQENDFGRVLVTGRRHFARQRVAVYHDGEQHRVDYPVYWKSVKIGGENQCLMDGQTAATPALNAPNLLSPAEIGAAAEWHSERSGYNGQSPTGVGDLDNRPARSQP